MSDRLEKQMEFIKEIDKQKNIFRQSLLTDASRKENDAEHAWHLAMMAMILEEYSNEKIDAFHTMKMVLIHDLVEIDAGDTYAYDEKGNESKNQRELLAAERIFGILPKDQADKVRALWDEFEENSTPEAKFANALDKVQPMMLNDASGGQAWKEHSICASQVYGRNSKTQEGSHKLWEYSDENFIKKNIKAGNLKDE